MKKLINDVDSMLSESLDGFAAAHADIVTLGEGGQFVRRRTPKPGKVALISGGGSGHEPLHTGFVSQKAAIALLSATMRTICSQLGRFLFPSCMG